MAELTWVRLEMDMTGDPDNTNFEIRATRVSDGSKVMLGWRPDIPHGGSTEVLMIVPESLDRGHERR